MVLVLRTLLPCLILFLLYLTLERLALIRSLRRVPLRIAVTGTRGKSSVTRLLASVLRENGRRVIAKTTGSQAIIQLPDGGEIELDRVVSASILEQKQLIRKAARLKADCMVAEVMSIQPENHFVESHRILMPNILVITNVRRDHTDVMGKSEEQVASTISLSIREGATVFIPEAENRTSFRSAARRCKAECIGVADGSSVPLLYGAPDLRQHEFGENLDLVCAVAAHLGVPPAGIIAGLRKAQHDIGGLRVWRYKPEGEERTLYLANAFAANDPESTFQVLSRVTQLLPTGSDNIIGILNLRADRAARTVQWISALKDGGLRRFQRLYVAGDFPVAVRWRVKGVQMLRGRSPVKMMQKVCAGAPDQALIFGFGNIKGCGRLLVDHWNRSAAPFRMPQRDGSDHNGI